MLDAIDNHYYLSRTVLIIVINIIVFGRHMGFCTRCKSLMPPNAIICRNCGNIETGDGGSRQSSLTNVPDNTVSETKIQTSAVRKEIKSNPDAPYLPYEPRGQQLETIKDIVKTLNAAGHIVIESGTGTGKTICSLASGLQHAKAEGKKILYLTRTISQSDQVMNELRSISQIQPVTGITLTGRKRSCPLLRTMKGYDEISPKALSTICEERKSKTLRGLHGCKYYERTKQEIISIESYCKRQIPTSEELDNYCESIGVCPYEAKKSIMSQMDVVVAPYVHMLSEDIRSNLLVSMKCSYETVLLIVDEAHNLIDAARDQESFVIRKRTIDQALEECDQMKNPWVFQEMPMKDFLTQVKNAVRSIAVERLSIVKREAKLEPHLLENYLLSKFEITLFDLSEIIEKMIELGESQTERMLDKGIHKISEVYALGTALKDWVLSPDDQYIKTIKADDEGEFLSAACIDPKDITGFMRGLKGAVHMSGTLQPLDQYIRTIGLPQSTVSRIYESPFPPENKAVIYVNELTTKYDEMKRDPGMMHRIEKMTVRLCNAVEKNTLVFFPSYGMMTKMRPYLEENIKRTLYWEESRQQKRTMASLDQFRRGRNGVFFTVMGGSIAEGIDFPGDELCFAVMIGIPYPPPTLESKAMADMFDQKYGFGVGWKYTSEVPALRKIKQAIGRLIRTPTDRGMAVILDSRISKYQKQLGAKQSMDPVKDAMDFFR